MNIALIGDVHGHFDLLYERVLSETPDVDLILTPGDFCPFRNKDDFKSTRIPEKHQDACSFEFNAYYKGDKRVPIPTLFIGGNHEPYGILTEIWEAQGQNAKLIENINFLGYHGYTELSGEVLAGLSGNYSPKRFDKERKRLSLKRKGHFVKEDLEYISNLSHIDYFMIHDWPAGTESYYTGLRRGSNLSPQLREVILDKKPRYVFAGHMHVSVDKEYSPGIRFIGLAILKNNSELKFSFQDKNNTFYVYG